MWVQLISANINREITRNNAKTSQRIVISGRIQGVLVSRSVPIFDIFCLAIALAVAAAFFAACAPKNTMLNLNEPRIVVKKGERRLELFDGESPVKTYPIVLGFAPAGDKEKSGDGKTPEGEFYIFVKNDKSKYHLSLGVSYPSSEDANRGLETGLISPEERDAILESIAEKRMPPQNTALGGEIYIHGGGTAKDWTWGCIALENADMTELYNAVRLGTRVTIMP
jgi:murein L,D-transpeptidase YafK